MPENSGKALVADDSATMRKVVGRVLGMMGHQVVGEAQDGQEAIDKAAELKPDLIMLDINMPNKTGVEALEVIVGQNPEAVVIMMTSVSDMDTVEKCIEMGAANYILKNSPAEEICNTIKEAWTRFNAWD